MNKNKKKFIAHMFGSDLVLWHSKKQKVVSCSSVEVEC